MASTNIDPGLRSIARWLPRGGIGRRSLEPIRLLTRLPARKTPPGVTVEEIGSASVRVHGIGGTDEPRPALLWIHGGGYVIGTAAQDDVICQQFARQLGIIVVSVDYRLAPEHPFPVPLHDCYDALSWLAHHPRVDPTRLAVGGASAGGGLAAALALLARDRGEFQLAFQLLVYPMLDDRTTLRNDIDQRSFRLWNNKSNRFGWKSYLGCEPGAADVSGLAAPARHGDLTSVAPAWLGVGTLDLFHDEDLDYAERPRESGVACVVDVVDGAFHGFDAVAPKARVSRDFRSAQVTALGAALGVEPGGRGRSPVTDAQ
jgi:acetyl esterase/lipase